MGHHFSFFRGGSGPGFPEDDPLRQFIRRHRKAILFVLGLGIILALFFALLAAIFFFKVVIPAFTGAATSGASQTGAETVKNWLARLANTNPLQWLNLLLQARG